MFPDNAFHLCRTMPSSEAARRQDRFRSLLGREHPQAGGLLCSGKVNIYYFTGHLGSGLLWLPLEGSPVLMLRKGTERAAEESPVCTVLPFRSFREIPKLCLEAGSPLSPNIAVDADAFSWTTSRMLESRLPGRTFTPADDTIYECRSVKTDYEIARLHICGRLHARVFDEKLPGILHAGMTERDAAVAFACEALKLGSDGLSRLRGHGEEMFFGYASAGTDGLCPTCYNGPLGCRGQDGAVPFLGSPDVVWETHSLLSVDMGFTYDGYHTDRTQNYWAGSEKSIPDELRKAQDACISIFMHALDSLIPGVTPAEIWLQAEKRAGRLGYGEQFMGMGRDQLRFLGHGTGLCLDEWPALARTFTKPLCEGMSIALEPKISVPGIGMAGLEHTCLLTEEKAEILTGSRLSIRALES